MPTFRSEVATELGPVDTGPPQKWRHRANYVNAQMGELVRCLCGYVGPVIAIGRAPLPGDVRRCPDCVRLNGGPW